MKNKFKTLLVSEEFGASQRAAKMRPKLGSRKRPMANILLGRETQFWTQAWFANVLLCTTGWDKVGLSCCWFPVFCLLSHTIVTTVASYLKFSIDSLAKKSQIGNASKLVRLPRLKHSQLPPLSLSLAPTFHQIRFRFFAGKHFVSVGQTLVTFVNVSRQTNNETLSIL